MILRVNNSKVAGKIRIPGSKSHTIRSLFLASMADGISYIKAPLISEDALSAAKVCSALGAEIEFNDNIYTVKGFNKMPATPSDIIDVGNSGTTLRFAVAAAAINEGCTVFTGDYQIRRRPLGPLISALNNLGASVFSTRDNGMAPVVVKGRLTGGKTELDAITSQYLSSLLISTPILENDTEIIITRLNEAPYVGMTLWWLDNLGIRYQNNDLKSFYIYGNQSYKAFNMTIPGDFSSATFFAALAAISGTEISMENLDMSDPQGDKLVLSILENMGAKIKYENGLVIVKGDKLKGIEIDMNSIPDALPAMAVVGCFAEGETRLVNVPQARLKETDRIHVMCKELTKMGADIEELPDGLIIRESKLKAAKVCGHDDHRIVMSLAIAGLNADGDTTIDTAEAMNITFPEFVQYINKCNGKAELIDSEM